jgi:hypothetical protein
MRYSRLVPIVAAVILIVNLLVVSGPAVKAAQRGNELCVAISGGTVQNATVLDIAADGGTGIGDASGGNGNLAFTADGGNENERDNGNGNGNGNNDNDNGRNGRNGNDDNGNRRNNRNDWSAESVLALEQRLLQSDTASAGNAGVGTASANGGVVSVGDINSGGNAGNAISVGDTHCPGAAPQKPSGGGGGHAAPSGGGGGGRGGKVKALPNTGVGGAGASGSGSLLLALGALSMVVLSHGYDYQRRVSEVRRR